MAKKKTTSSKASTAPSAGGDSRAGGTTAYEHRSLRWTQAGVILAVITVPVAAWLGYWASDLLRARDHAPPRVMFGTSYSLDSTTTELACCVPTEPNVIFATSIPISVVNDSDSVIEGVELRVRVPANSLPEAVLELYEQRVEERGVEPVEVKRASYFDERYTEVILGVGDLRPGLSALVEFPMVLTDTMVQDVVDVETADGARVRVPYTADYSLVVTLSVFSRNRAPTAYTLNVDTLTSERADDFIQKGVSRLVRDQDRVRDDLNSWQALLAFLSPVRPEQSLTLLRRGWTAVPVADNRVAYINDSESNYEFTKLTLPRMRWWAIGVYVVVGGILVSIVRRRPKLKAR